MIGIQLILGLGNQMFQYAAARAIAERIGCRLVVMSSNLDRRDKLRYVGGAIGLPISDYKSIPAELGQVFPAVTQSGAGVALQIAGARISKLLFPHRFSLRRIVDSSGVTVEYFDPDFTRIKSGTWLQGFFQSEAYFANVKSDVRRWFQLPPTEENVIKNIISNWPERPERMIAIHMRRGDYLQQSGSLSTPGQGWALPQCYFDNALAQLPSGLGFAVFSDDPDYARQVFAPLKPWVSARNPGFRDLHLMAACRHVVIANSSFSWWGAWLNPDPNKVVIAPRFHLGWRIGRWYPEGIQVAGWNYIDVQQCR